MPDEYILEFFPYVEETEVKPEDLADNNEAMNRLFTSDIYNAMNNNAAGDDYDKEVVRNMTLCGEVIGGLILEDQHPEWMGLNYEEILERAAEEIKPQIQQAIEQQQNMPKMEIHIEEENHSPEYIEIYNKIIDKYDDDKYSDQELVDLVEKALQDGEIDL